MPQQLEAAILGSPPFAKRADRIRRPTRSGCSYLAIWMLGSGKNRSKS